MGATLRIATVTAGAGRIGICRLPGLYRNLRADMSAIVRWKPAIVVSMTERDEMDRLGGGGLAAMLADASIDWAHLPIRDFGGLEGNSKDAWPGLAARLHIALSAGNGVLLHCRGGRGRSGMIAVRLLVERGEAAETALSRVRAARPGAVETTEQFAWAGARSARTEL